MADPSGAEMKAHFYPPGEKELDWLQKGIKKVGFFSKLTPPQLEAMLYYMLMVNYPKGYCICEEDAAGDALYIIYKGSVLITKKGWDKPVATLRESDFFGEMSLLFGQPRSATVTTIEPGILFCLSSDDFKAMLKKHPNMVGPIREVAEARRKELARS